ncbi:exported protein, unknown function [Hepatocystis sp. ex Piliocolobus tephrosceles]|nr:exported protein, unknown function [Hepatocystis sp. ex Piliocolobus tephrosceles]
MKLCNDASIFNWKNFIAKNQICSNTANVTKTIKEKYKSSIQFAMFTTKVVFFFFLFYLLLQNEYNYWNDRIPIIKKIKNYTTYARQLAAYNVNEKRYNNNIQVGMNKNNDMYKLRKGLSGIMKVPDMGSTDSVYDRVFNAYSSNTYTNTNEGTPPKYNNQNKKQIDASKRCTSLNMQHKGETFQTKNTPNNGRRYENKTNKAEHVLGNDKKNDQHLTQSHHQTLQEKEKYDKNIADNKLEDYESVFKKFATNTEKANEKKTTAIAKTENTLSLNECDKSYETFFKACTKKKKMEDNTIPPTPETSSNSSVSQKEQAKKNKITKQVSESKKNDYVPESFEFYANSMDVSFINITHELKNILEKHPRDFDTLKLLVLYNMEISVMRYNFLNLQNNLYKIWISLTNQYQLDNYYANKCWSKIYTRMIKDLFYKEKKYLHKLHCTLQNGNCSNHVLKRVLLIFDEKYRMLLNNLFEDYKQNLYRKARNY